MIVIIQYFIKKCRIPNVQIYNENTKKIMIPHQRHFTKFRVQKR